MPPDYKRIQQRIQAFDFKGLFTQELMWNHLQTRELQVPTDGVTYTLLPVAERGMAVYICVPPSDAAFPKYPTRRKIDVQVSKTAREHIIIFHDAAKTVQIWQWVKKEAGRPSACREQIYYAGQSADALTQKVQGIEFSLEDEPSVLETRARVGAAFDVEKVTKKFYEQFKKEHDAFLKFIKGIPEEHLQRWYVSVMLNRLMFIYFIQKKGFLSGDNNYLGNKLEESKRRGKDHFYIKFLCPLFFEGFAKREEQRSPEINRLLGRIPYLNGGLFLKHQIEDLHGEKIEVPDRAFERIFEFFEQYDWHLDDRPTRTGREINPDVLGYVFEKYINQKEMGAYYSKEDITGYISQNTIIPALFDMARKSCRIAFEGEHTVWRLLQQDSDRYIYPAILHGIDKELPVNIAKGINDVSKRIDWNKTATPDLGLPTETWREAVARRERCSETRKKLAAGQIQNINELITYNLDIRRFAEEVISNAEGPELLRAFYKSIESISVLDPACGSGAFLFAALNILERLYDTCLSRMQAFVDDLDRSNQKHSPEKYSDFRKALAEMNDKGRHPSPRYFILKSIILNNLYGVDIMEEATEICKLRLFLKMVAQVNANEKVEPLPDIDFNVRAGNTLVGYVNRESVKQAIGSRLNFDDTLQEIQGQAEEAERAFERFRDMQVEFGMEPNEFAAAKSEVKRKLSLLRNQLDEYLAGDYGIKSRDKHGLARWRESHQPFHWFTEFFGIMNRGGFDVVLGNPPYVEYAKIKSKYSIRGYSTLESGNLYAYFCELSLSLLANGARFGMIVPLSIASTDRMQSLRRMFASQSNSVHISHYSGDAHPAVLFEGVKMRLSIVLSEKHRTNNRQTEWFSTNFMRWYSEARSSLFQVIKFAPLNSDLFSNGLLPKVGDSIATSILEKIQTKHQVFGGSVVTDSKDCIFAHRIVAHFIKCFDFVPFFRNDRDGQKRSEDYKVFGFGSRPISLVASAVLNSTLFYFYYLTYSDAYHCGRELILNFPCDLPSIRLHSGNVLIKFNEELMEDLQKNAIRRRIRYHGTGWIEYDEFYPKKSKALIDRIDEEVRKHYGLSDEQLDYLLNFDIKFRLGQGKEDEPDDVDQTALAAY